MKYINLVSGPRNISTALMYSFAQRPDTRVFDEPFYACYLSQTGLDHPAKEEVLQQQSSDPAIVVDSIFRASDKPVSFIKNMAHHMAFVPVGFADRVMNVFLIRNPSQILASYAQVIETPTLADIGVEYQFSLLHRLRAQGKQPLVLDSSAVLADPESVLTKVCTYLDIPFMKAMLKWPPGPKSFDGIWAKYWYKNVHTSSGFQPQATSNRPLPARLSKLNEEAQYYYQALVPFAVQP
jgi:hypothetical protein